MTRKKPASEPVASEPASSPTEVLASNHEPAVEPSTTAPEVVTVKVDALDFWAMVRALGVPVSGGDDEVEEDAFLILDRVRVVSAPLAKDLEDAVSLATGYQQDAIHWKARHAEARPGALAGVDAILAAWDTKLLAGQTIGLGELRAIRKAVAALRSS